MSLLREITSPSEDQTAALAAEIGLELKPGDIVFLRGNLGTGKSTFARALVRTLMSQPDLDVPSPTFNLVYTYDTPEGTLWHFDLYRLKNHEDVYELGWEDALGEQAIILVEWPERFGPLEPVPTLDIRFSPVDNKPDSRLIQVRKPG